MFQYNKNDTISAISTPIGEGAISIVRLSGKQAISIVNKFFSKDIKKFKAKTVNLGKILDKNKNIIDTVVLILYLSPNSYTGEDVIEIHCHGGRLITQKVYETTLLAGARPSNPGEFTLRAFLNNKLDLTQAEAIQDLISAKNTFALKAATNHLDGMLSKKIKKLQKDLTEITAVIEAWLDFPEEDLGLATKKEILDKLEQTFKDMQKLANTFEEGKIIKEGLKICIIGTPNVGKSSLMNTMLKKDRAIVTKIPGTTRDILQEDIKLNHMHFQLTDTAGIRKSSCLIEKEGIKRSKITSYEADIVLLVLDASRKLNEDDKILLNETNKQKTIIIWNKIDLVKPKEKIEFPNLCQISAKENIGLEKLYKLIENLTFKSKISNEEVILTQKRHKIALDDAISNLKKAINNLKNDISYEFVSIDLKSTLKALSKIIGFDITEDILSSIFSNFCIGK